MSLSRMVFRLFKTAAFKKNSKFVIDNSQPSLFGNIRMMSSQATNFQDAMKRVKTLKADPGNDVKLKLYSLFKQATEGQCSASKPSAFDFVGKAKWDAWNSLGAMSQDEAKEKYISLVDELCGVEQSDKTDSEKKNSKYDGLLYNVSTDITNITFNRPDKRNAITVQMYKDIMSALKDAGENDTAVTILSGQGDYFSSGNDLSNFANISGDLTAAAKNAADMLQDFVAAFIDFPKILVAAVNGPAVGIPVTILGLCDVVYASDKATFQTPFSLLGQSPEGCSTYTFPKIMGYSKANELLFFNKKISALEAKEVGLVSEIFKHETFMEDVQKQLSFLPSASKQSMIFSKALSRGLEKATLHQVNKMECERLVERWQSPDCMEALMKFFQRKAKL
ncbi:enoyl-CoA delta isomerase 2-like [Uloborus diversus]|uniref:enoyl-CoA delta isomerase 2-like n=1 Tax=Uloborus diversus TaxID=327109 RepID=UPI002409A170|nr:enoyl-CoA delta isomerase 2-like [Uloborus diversus]